MQAAGASRGQPARPTAARTSQRRAAERRRRWRHDDRRHDDRVGSAARPHAASAPAVSSRSGHRHLGGDGPAGRAVPVRRLEPRRRVRLLRASPPTRGRRPASACRTSRVPQYASVPHVSQAEAQPGDLLFYYSPISHVGIYLGGGQLVHAPNTGSSSRSLRSTGARSPASADPADPVADSADGRCEPRRQRLPSSSVQSTDQRHRP